jgi:hypothetical protein
MRQIFNFFNCTITNNISKIIVDYKKSDLLLKSNHLISIVQLFFAFKIIEKNTFLYLLFLISR